MVDSYSDSVQRCARETDPLQIMHDAMDHFLIFEHLESWQFVGERISGVPLDPAS